MLFLLWIVNFVISWFNAWSVGHTWKFSKTVGGFYHILIWMVAIMSAAGFTWCYSIVLAFAASMIPITDDATGVSHPILSSEDLQVYLDFIYILIILPILGSGMAITAFSWAQFWKHRNFANGATAAWNTYAQIHNTVGAFQHVPRAFDNVSSFFDGKSNDAKGKLMILLVAIAIFGGVLTTTVIARKAMRESKFLLGNEIEA